jgi:hypothetical protein
MPVRVDEARHADGAAALDDLNIRQVDARADRDDRAVAYMHVAGFEISEARIHRQHGCAADDEFGTRRQRRGGAGGNARARLLGGKFLRYGSQRAKRGRPLQYRTAVQKIVSHLQISLFRVARIGGYFRN